MNGALRQQAAERLRPAAGAERRGSGEVFVGELAGFRKVIEAVAEATEVEVRRRR
ncbi:MAG TPA: hypothetical protein VHL59_16120 [Thermoanaerobaculia bacterium]|nr:hypothetical protein [Thermoanaerobaculia bacterium]